MQNSAIAVSSAKALTAVAWEALAALKRGCFRNNAELSAEVRRFFDCAYGSLRAPGLIPATSIVATVPPDRSLVSVDLRTDEISSTGGHRFFAPFSTENEHTGSFSGRSEPQNDTLNALLFRMLFEEIFATEEM